jgi:multicomponent Na+:H+ antiporter subunit D
MIYHPAAIIFAFIPILLASYNRDLIFRIAAIAMPVIIIIFCSTAPKINSIEFFHITLIYNYDGFNAAVNTAFIFVLFCANMYAIAHNNKKELILGSCYAGATFLCLLAGDFISMLIGLELMVVFSSMIIFIGGIRSSLRSAKKYFLTHLVSSSMIIIGIAYLITKNNSLEIAHITDLLNQPNYSKIALHIMLIGMLINIAAFPFSGWMVNYYPKATPAGFLYLISFTTKVSIMLLLKLFAGYEALKYVAIIMMLYASVKAIFEDNLLSIICYLSIISMGFMLLAISNGNYAIIPAITIYLFIDILYKLLMSIAAASIIDQTGIHDASDLRKIKDRVVLLGLGISILMMMNLPITTSFYAKLSMSEFFTDPISNFAIIFSSFMSILVVPWKQYFAAKKSFRFHVPGAVIFSIIVLTIILLGINIAKPYFSVFSDIKMEFHISAILKQIAIILIALPIGFLWKIKRKITKPINLIETMGNIFFYFYNYYTNKRQEALESEPLTIKPLEQQMLKKLASFHNQQTAIFVVFSVFTIMLMVLMMNIL